MNAGVGGNFPGSGIRRDWQAFLRQGPVQPELARLIVEERLCSGCGKPLPDMPYRYKFCPVCRSLYGIQERSSLARKNRFSTKGRDRVAERLRDAFEMIRDDDP